MSTIQYTLRGIPERLDEVARERARRQNQSLNATLVEALGRGLGLDGEVRRYHDLDDLAGTWVEDPEFDQAIRDLDRVDEAMWP